MHRTSLWRRLHTRATLFSGWTWVAAGCLIGFEMLDVVFGAFILAPELLPLAILGLALVWQFRDRLRRARVSLRVRVRLARVRRRTSQRRAR
ncbi:hypothetical protein [Leifsonia sp. 71-9]|uniref:hypothetical protein n=1 Tax=Leifsonia sp. 71-9 TaxID=1895934 RepID=UPI00092B2AAC|nr:hypothetical protein [Leifsonia sp. 71-9]OJX77495.1 MAG: hypothetical protein BGO91_10200 [Leifsonia sp. 71-9]